MKTLRIYGDSIMKGVIYTADSKKTYKIAKNALKKEMDDLGVVINNNSKMGATINDGLMQIKKTLPDCDENTMVLLEYGGNDCDYNWKDISDNPQGKFMPRTEENTFVAYYKNAIEYIRSKGAKVAIATLIPINSQKYMGQITKNLVYDNILKWLGDVSMLGRWQERYNTLVQKIAYSMSCPIIDIRNEFLMAHNYSELMCDDGIHPTELGHRKIHDTVYGFVKNMA